MIPLELDEGVGGSAAASTAPTDEGSEANPRAHIHGAPLSRFLLRGGILNPPSLSLSTSGPLLRPLSATVVCNGEDDDDDDDGGDCVAGTVVMFTVMVMVWALM